MANWNTLKTAVANIINTNGNQAITGQLLQNVLNNIITNVGENSTFAGLAYPETNPGTPDGPVFYIATTPGVYYNFSGYEIRESEAVLFVWNNGSWEKKYTGFASSKYVTKLKAYNSSIALTKGIIEANNDERKIKLNNWPGFFIDGKFIEIQSEFEIDYGVRLFKIGYTCVVYNFETEGFEIISALDVVIGKHIILLAFYVKDLQFHSSASDGAPMYTYKVDYISHCAFGDARVVENGKDIWFNGRETCRNISYLKEFVAEEHKSEIINDQLYSKDIGFISSKESKVLKASIDATYKYVMSTSVVAAEPEPYAVVNYLNSDGIFIGSELPLKSTDRVTYSNFELTVPSEAKYVLINWRPNTADGTEGPDFPLHLSTSYAEPKERAYEMYAGITSEEISPVQVSYDKLYYEPQGGLLGASDGIVKKYEIDTSKKYIVSSYSKALNSGFPIVAFTDENDIFISSEFEATSWGTSIINKTIEVPENAKYLYLTSRYDSKYPILREKKVNGYLPVIKSLQKEISILFIGNSLTQDAVSYLPFLMTRLIPDVKFKFYVWYNGGKTLTNHYEDYFLPNRACDIFSICEDGISWTNTTKTMKSILETHRFDIVSLQEYFNYKTEYTSEDLQVYENIISYIQDNYKYPFKVISLLHQPKRDNSTEIFNLTIQGITEILKNTATEDLLAPGIAVYDALQTELDNLGSAGHLSPDGTHTQEGLPCLMQAYVIFLWICEHLGIQKSILGNTEWVTPEIYQQINVPGANLGSGVITGTLEQNRLAQKIAIQAYKKGKGLLQSALSL